MKVAYIMRGVPGSGKSTLAKQLAKDDGVIHSTDDFFCIDGEYRFDPEKLSEYHDLNFAAFCLSLNRNVQTVILDNTNTKRWHFERYVTAAKQAGYLVALVVLPHLAPEVGAERTVHNIPSFAIQRMINGWEN